ncbi:MAG TPA: branched-chain amino acid transaminase [Terriglobales bacterium]|nr:branched-chain amino acid transaminase [Terriglobales bacterium]
MAQAKTIWMNGTWVPWDEARIHVLTHAMHYASSLFEGIRAYDTPKGPAIFRLEEHVDRLMFSARVYRMEKEMVFTRDQIRDVCLQAVAVNDLKDCYIRPLVYRAYEHMGVNPFGNPVHVMVAAFPWGQYLGKDALEKGSAIKIGTWQRIAPNTLPAMVKASANYMNSQLLKMEALVDGYDEALALDVHGFISEGSGMNVFAVLKGEIVTPPLSNSVLAGITRATVMTLAREMGTTVREETMPREMLYVADEVFYTGTAVEVSPITSVDKIPVGNGTVGPVTRALQKAYFGAVRGQTPDTHHWLSLVPQGAAAAR